MYRSFVIKIGTASWIQPHSGIQKDVLANLFKQIVTLRSKGIHCILVVSGAIGCGHMILNKKRKENLSLPEKQALAATGQIHLMNTFSQELGLLGVNCAQILLSADDFHNRERYLNIRNTLHYLLTQNIIPVINENDTVTVDELRFGDNDNLASMVSGLLRSEFLIFLSQVKGIINYQTNTVIDKVNTVEEVFDLIENHRSEGGTGGMQSKLSAIKKATSMGSNCLIGSCHTPHILTDLLQKKYNGTFFKSKKNKLTSRKSWIAFSRREEGVIVIDRGAYQALTEGGSLLTCGIKNTTGLFSKGDLVRILCNKKEVGKGLINCSYNELATWMIQKSDYQTGYNEVIHRNNFVFTDPLSTPPKKEGPSI